MDSYRTAQLDMNAANANFRTQSQGTISSVRSNGVAPAASFSFRPPEPPSIIVPGPTTGNPLMAPSFNGLGGDDITDVELGIITQTDFRPVDRSVTWKYGLRRQAQMVLPFLYLGPWDVLKSQKDYLQKEEISLLLVVRDKTTARAGIMSPKKTAEQLGILYDSIDVQDNQELITAFPHAVKVINNHLINCYRQQVQAGGNSGQLPSSFRMGKVFVFCESGNERSAAVVAAYILAMYNVSLGECLVLVQAQRFCVSFDEPMKNLLKSYKDILVAQRDVRKARLEARNHLATITNGSGVGSGGSTAAKRGRSVDADEDVEMGDDGDRFEGRAAFQPFIQDS